jgi:hypothetical protein
VQTSTAVRQYQDLGGKTAGVSAQHRQLSIRKVAAPGPRQHQPNLLDNSTKTTCTTRTSATSKTQQLILYTTFGNIDRPRTLTTEKQRTRKAIVRKYMYVAT